MNTKDNLIILFVLIMVSMIFLSGCAGKGATAASATAEAMAGMATKTAEVAASETGTAGAVEATKVAGEATGIAQVEAATAEFEATQAAEAEVTKAAQAQATATAGFEATAQAKQEATATAVVQATETAQAHATATAQAQATATAVVQIEKLAIIAAVQENLPLSGPRTGTMAHIDDDFFESVYANVNVRDFVVEANFTTDSEGSREGNRDIGFVLRDSNAGYLVLLVELGDYWELSYFDNEEFTLVQDGQLTNLNTDATPNALIVYAEEGQGLFFVNGQFIADLDLSDLETAGDIAVATGVYVGNENAWAGNRVRSFFRLDGGRSGRRGASTGRRPAHGRAWPLWSGRKPGAGHVIRSQQHESFGGMIDNAIREGSINCFAVVNTYDGAVSAPSFDASGGSAAEQNAYAGYRAAVATFAEGTRDMSENCRNFLADPENSGPIPFQQWGLGRQKVNEALDILHQAEQALGT